MSLGFDEDDFWRKTPRQIATAFKGKAAQFRREHNERAWMVWHIVAMPRSKRLPPIRKLMVKDRDRRPQSSEQMLSIAKQWTLLLGGEVTGKPN